MRSLVLEEDLVNRVVEPFATMGLSGFVIIFNDNDEVALLGCEMEEVIIYDHIFETMKNLAVMPFSLPDMTEGVHTWLSNPSADSLDKSLEPIDLMTKEIAFEVGKNKCLVFATNEHIFGDDYSIFCMGDVKEIIHACTFSLVNLEMSMESEGTEKVEGVSDSVASFKENLQKFIDNI